MAVSGDQTIAVNNGGCNITFQCCELSGTQGLFMNVTLPNGEHVEVESVNRQGCIKHTMLPHASNNGTLLSCLQGTVEPIKNTLKYEVVSQNEGTTVINTSTQGIYMYM